MRERFRRLADAVRESLPDEQVKELIEHIKGGAGGPLVLRFLAEEFDTQALAALRNRHSGAPALVLGNGWRLNHMREWRAAPGVVCIGTNLSIRMVDSPYLVHIDKAVAPPPTYQGITITASQRPRSLFGWVTEYWEQNAKLAERIFLTGPYAVEVAVFLGCSPIYLVGFDGDRSPSGCRNFQGRPQKKLTSALATRTNAWLESARANLARRDGPKILGVTFGGALPAIRSVDGFVKAQDCPALERKRRGSARR